MKKKIILIILVLISIGTTYAYFSKSITAENLFNTSSFNVTIYEDNNSTWGDKNVSFTNSNNAKSGAVLRIMYNEIFKINEVVATSNKHNDYNPTFLANTTYGQVLSNKINNTDVVTKTWTSTFNNYFVSGNDGWYYYTKVLNPGDTIRVLQSITLNNNLISNLPNYNDYLNATYDLNFDFEAVQASTRAVSNLWGLNITINNGGNVLWNF